MGGGGGSGTSFFDSATPEELRKAILKAETQVAGSTFEADLAEELGRRLTASGERDVEATRRRLDKIRSAIASDVEGVVEVRLGGSVAKRTYVDGLSDVDALLLVHRTELAEYDPDQVLNFVAKKIREALKGDAQVQAGKMAVTASYSDGATMDLLPALRGATGFHIASPDGKTWSKIAPQRFAEALTRHNTQHGGKLVPVIKLAKAINHTLPPEQRLSGYHIESLSIEAFRGYSGLLTPAVMLRHYFERAKELVLRPIKDTTGQSLHVDDYLGPRNSVQRRRVAHLMDRITRRMANATAAQSVDQWRDLLGDLGP